MDSKEISDYDQAQTNFMVTVVPSLRAMYLRLVDEGFNEEQAFTLTRDYLKSMISGASNGNT